MTLSPTAHFLFSLVHQSPSCPHWPSPVPVLLVPREAWTTGHRGSWGGPWPPWLWIRVGCLEARALEPSGRHRWQTRQRTRPRTCPALCEARRWLPRSRAPHPYGTLRVGGPAAWNLLPRVTKQYSAGLSLSSGWASCTPACASLACLPMQPPKPFCTPAAPQGGFGLQGLGGGAEGPGSQPASACMESLGTSWGPAGGLPGRETGAAPTCLSTACFSRPQAPPTCTIPQSWRRKGFWALQQVPAFPKSPKRT